MQGWIEEAGLDGLILARTVSPECFLHFVDLVVPESQSRGISGGICKRAYAEGTLRAKLLSQE